MRQIRQYWVSFFPLTQGLEGTNQHLVLAASVDLSSVLPNLQSCSCRQGIKLLFPWCQAEPYPPHAALGLVTFLKYRCQYIKCLILLPLRSVEFISINLGSSHSANHSYVGTLRRYQKMKKKASSTEVFLHYQVYEQALQWRLLIFSAGKKQQYVSANTDDLAN